MADQTFWQWVATGLLGMFMAMSRWIGMREVKRVDTLEIQLHQLEKEVVPRSEIRDILKDIREELGKIDKKLDRHNEGHP